MSSRTMAQPEIKKPRRESDARASESVIKLEINHMKQASTAALRLQEPRSLVEADSPETAFILNPQLDPRCFDDVMNCSLARAAAVVDLLLGDISENSGFTYPAATVSNTLWLLQGQIAQMRALMRGYVQGGAV